MYNKKQLFFICTLFFFISPLFCAYPPFIKSFIQFYELSNEGRFTHEYHPFLLKKTALSFQELEDKCIENGYTLAHRILIMGYEKAAAPHYFFNPNECKGTAINDEMLNKTLFGFTQTNHNLFGFMTGFLFKHMPSSKDFFTSHINPKTIILFDPRAQRFQLDFFGSLYYFLREKEALISKQLYQQNGSLLINECIDFWQTLYAHNSNNKENPSAGTQDILFTIEHARQIKKSSVPLKAFFTGADITYPINETSKKKRSATRNAQEMVAQFSEHLLPVNNQNTLYVFRSFVDGVGKSTMLSNIKNWKKYKKDISSYQTTDNASSQIAELFQYDEQVYIADLPAQLSHFTYKPDGAVFVEYEACSDLSCSKEELLTHIKNNLTEIHQKSSSALKQIKHQKPESLATQETDDYFTAFIKNMLLLELDQSHEWTPFIYKNQTFIFDKKENIRVCVPLSHAPSEGLKNSAPEQMLFVNGVRFPLSYKLFLEDLTLQAKKHQIKQIVFVDFLSMYARSSREAIRLNYLIQQIKILFPTMHHQKSLYTHFSSNAELLYHLMQPDFFEKSLQYIAAESLIRSELFTFIEEEMYQDLQGIPLNQISKNLSLALAKTLPKTEADLQTQLYKKLHATQILLKEQYAQSKEFVHLFSHNGSSLYSLSKLIVKTLSSIKYPFKNPWKIKGKRVLEKEKTETGPCNKKVELDNGQTMRAIYVFDPHKHSLLERAEFFSLLKKWWIPALLSAMKANKKESDRYLCKKIYFPLAPLCIKKGLNSLWYCLQPDLPPLKTHISYKKIEDLNLQNHQKIKWGSWHKTPLISDFSPADTYSGIYGFGYSALQSFSNKMFPQIFDEAVSQIIRPLFERLRPSDTIALTTVVETLKKEKKHSLLQWCHKECKNQAKEEREKAPKKNGKKEKKEEVRAFKPKRIKSINKEALPFIKELSQLLASVILHAPDQQSPFSFALDNKEDFTAALWLIKKVLLPQYLGIFYLEERK